MKINRIKWIVWLLEKVFRKKGRFNSGCSSRRGAQASSALGGEEVSKALTGQLLLLGNIESIMNVNCP